MTTQTDTDALVERLMITIHKINGHWWNYRKRPTAPEIHEAATHITTQAAQIAELEQTLIEADRKNDATTHEWHQAEAQIAALTERVRVLEGALEPFARGPDRTSLAKLYGHLNRQHYHDARAARASKEPT